MKKLFTVYGLRFPVIATSFVPVLKSAARRIAVANILKSRRGDLPPGLGVPPKPLPSPNPKLFRRSAPAFSLVELLVSMTILTTLMVLLFGFFEQATRAWQNSEKKVDAFREARAALYFLKRDLEGLLVDASIPFFQSDDPSAFSPIIYSGPGGTPTANGDLLFFISSQSFDAQDSARGKSDLCAVGYYPVYDRDSAAMGNRRSYRLLRYFKSSDDTWENGSAGLKVFLTTVQSGTPDYAVLFPPAQGTADRDEVIARNVVNFKVQPLDENYQPLLATNGNRFNTKPAFFDISLTALNQETAQKLSVQDDWHKLPPGYSNSPLFKQNAQEFRLRVAVPK